MPIAKSQYSWLDTLPGPLPRMVAEARKLHGTIEAPGKFADNPTILGWAKEVGGDVARDYTADEIPWCGLFMSVVARRAGKTPPTSPLWALSWNTFGSDAGQPALGDVLTFIRPGGGHVALYVGEDTTTYHVIGGNQSDSVCYTRIEKMRLKAARRPPYMTQPASVRPYRIKAEGGISTDEH